MSNKSYLLWSIVYDHSILSICILQLSTIKSFSFFSYLNTYLHLFKLHLVPSWCFNLHEILKEILEKKVNFPIPIHCHSCSVSLFVYFFTLNSKKLLSNLMMTNEKLSFSNWFFCVTTFTFFFDFNQKLILSEWM